MRLYGMMAGLLASVVAVATAGANDWEITSFVPGPDGLAGIPVRAVCEDNSGVLWFGTDAGLSRYDGADWDTYTTADALADNTVYDIAFEMGQGPEIWIATANGVSVAGIQPDAVTFATPYRMDNTGLVSNMVFAAEVDPTHMKWFGTDSGLSSFDGENWHTYNTDNEPLLLSDWITDVAYSVLQGFSFNLIATLGGGVSRFDATTGATTYDRGTTLLGQEPGIVSDSVYVALEASTGHQWFGTLRGLVAHTGFWPDEPVWHHFSAVGDVPVYALAEDGAGNIWIGKADGLMRLEFPDTTFVSYTTADGLAGNTVYDIVAAADGSIWCATDGGVSRLQEVTAVLEQPVGSAFAILGVAPNPFNPRTTISFTIPEAATVRLDVFSLSGQRVRTLMDGPVATGRHQAVWDGRNETGDPAASGVYFVRMSSGAAVSTAKMLLMK